MQVHISSDLVYADFRRKANTERQEIRLGCLRLGVEMGVIANQHSFFWGKNVLELDSGDDGCTML